MFSLSVHVRSLLDALAMKLRECDRRSVLPKMAAAGTSEVDFRTGTGRLRRHDSDYGRFRNYLLTEITRPLPSTRMV